MVMPVAANVVAGVFEKPYQPQLPISAERVEPVYNIRAQAGKQIYPTLTSALHTEEGNWIRIPSIDVNVPLVTSLSLDDRDILKTLDYGVALYPNNVLPGRLGNVFISAHSTGEPWKGAYRFAFLRIDELQPGNVIHLDYEGTRYTYEITGSEVIVPTPEYHIQSDRPIPTMTLMACWPLWSTQKRLLVHSQLMNITKLTPRPI